MSSATAIAESGNPIEYEIAGVLGKACEKVGLDPADAELVKHRVNAVYRLRTAPVIARIGFGPRAMGIAERAVMVADWLRAEGAPVTALHPCADRPIEIDGRVVTFWRAETGRAGRGKVADLADVLRAWHRIEPSPELPRWRPFEEAQEWLAEAPAHVCADDLAWLADQWSLVAEAYRDIEPTLEHGLIHGDAHTGNLVWDDTGRPLLCDLDCTAAGPLWWDLVPIAVNAVRYGGTARHERLAARYGVDITAEPVWPILRRIRELHSVTSVLPDLARRAIAERHAHRLDSLRAGDDNALWAPYDAPERS